MHGGSASVPSTKASDWALSEFYSGWIEFTPADSEPSRDLGAGAGNENGPTCAGLSRARLHRAGAALDSRWSDGEICKLPLEEQSFLGLHLQFLSESHPTEVSVYKEIHVLAAGEL